MYGVYRWPKTDFDDSNRILIAETATVEEAAYTADEAKELWGAEWAIGYKNLSMKGKQDERRKPG